MFTEKWAEKILSVCAPIEAAISLMPGREEIVTEHSVIKVTIIWLCSSLDYFLQVKASEHQQAACLDTQSQVTFPIFFYPYLHINSDLPTAHIIVCFDHVPRLDSSTLRDDGQVRGFVSSHRPIVPFSAYCSENPQEVFVNWMNNNNNNNNNEKKPFKVVLNFTARYTPTNPRLRKAFLVPTHQLLTMIFLLN